MSDRIAMADECECNVSEIITKCLLNTCRLLPRLTKSDVEAVVTCVSISMGHQMKEKEAN